MAAVRAAIVWLTRGVADIVLWLMTAVSLVEVAGTPVPVARPARLAAAKVTVKVRAGRMVVVVPYDGNALLLFVWLCGVCLCVGAQGV